MNELKTKALVVYTKHKKYIDITFALIVVAFMYALQKGNLDGMVNILKVANEILKVVLNVG